jgi:hypothetical protein
VSTFATSSIDDWTFTRIFGVAVSPLLLLPLVGQRFVERDGVVSLGFGEKFDRHSEKEKKKKFKYNSNILCYPAISNQPLDLGSQNKRPYTYMQIQKKNKQNPHQ